MAEHGSVFCTGGYEPEILRGGGGSGTLVW